MRTYFQGKTYLVEFSDADTTCFARHTDADPSVVYGSGAFVFDSGTGDLVGLKGEARQHEGDIMWLAFSQDAQDFGRGELAGQGVAVNPYDFCPYLPELAHNPAKGHAYEGRRIELVHTSDPFTHLRPGIQGSVTHVDDLGTIFVLWDDKTRLGLVPGEDHFEFLTQGNPEPARISRTRGVKTMRGPYPERRGYAPWITRKGKLGKGFLTTMTAAERKKALDKCVRDYGYQSCLGSIMVLERARRGPRGRGEGVGEKYASELRTSREYLRRKYGGKGSFGARKRAGDEGLLVASGNPGEFEERDPAEFEAKLEDLSASYRNEKTVWKNLYRFDGLEVTADVTCGGKSTQKVAQIVEREVRKRLDDAMAQEESADQLRFGGKGWGKWVAPKWRGEVKVTKGEDNNEVVLTIDVPMPRTEREEAALLRALTRVDESIDEIEKICVGEHAPRAAKTKRPASDKPKKPAKRQRNPLRAVGDKFVDLWGEEYTIVQIEPNHLRRAPDYLSRSSKSGQLIWIPAGNVKGEDMDLHRKMDEEARQRHLAQLQRIREKFVKEDWHKRWPGCESGKALVGQSLDAAIAEVRQDLESLRKQK